MKASRNTNICEERTFESIHTSHANDLKRFLFFKTQDINIAEDILQDAFIKLWDNCSEVNFDKVKSYLFTMANNMFLNHVKHQKVVRKLESKPFDDRTIENPEFIIIEKEFLERLNKTISSLPENERTVFIMNRIEKKKYKEIAEQLEISIKTVEKRMHAALLIMRKEIGNI